MSGVEPVGDPQEAIAHYQKLVAARPDDADGWYALAFAARDAGDLVLARDALESASRLGLENADTHALMADVCLRMGDYDEAARHAEEAIQRSTDSTLQAWLHYLLGQCRRKMEDIDGQLVHFQAAIALDPRDVDAQYALGLVLFEDGQARSAVDHFREAVNLKPEDAALWFALGCAAHAAGNLPLAARALERTVSLGRDDGQTRLELAKVWWKLDDVEAAMRHAERALAFPLSAERRKWLQWLLPEARFRLASGGPAVAGRGGGDHERG